MRDLSCCGSGQRRYVALGSTEGSPPTLDMTLGFSGEDTEKILAFFSLSFCSLHKIKVSEASLPFIPHLRYDVVGELEPTEYSIVFSSAQDTYC